jgi:hypothetical protein
MTKLFLVALVAFFCETIDSSLGMGYGTLLTPLLLLMGYEPLEVVPLILLSEFITGLLSAFMHHKIGNVNLHRGTRESKIAIILAGCSIIGTILAAYLAISIPAYLVKGYIALLLIAVGLMTFFSINRKIVFSWKKIYGLGILASFNKGISGGGYGPLITGGQMMAGLDSKSAIGITSLSEGLTCMIGVISFFLFKHLEINWLLGLALLIGAIFSIPFSVNFIRIIKEQVLKKLLSFAVLFMGVITLFITLQDLLPDIFLWAFLPLLFITIPLLANRLKEQKKEPG